MLLDEIAYKNNPPKPKRKNTEDFSDWPDHDVNKKFKRIPKHQRNKLVQGFSLDLNNNNRRKNTGTFQTNIVHPYPAVKPMGLTRFGDKQSLYTTGDLEHDNASGISSAVIRGDTDDMSVPNLEGTDFDNVRHSERYGKPYVPLTQQERDHLINQVDATPYSKNKELIVKSYTEKDPITGFESHVVRANRPVPVLSGDDFDNIQSAGKSRRRARNRTNKTRKNKIKKGGSWLISALGQEILGKIRRNKHEELRNSLYSEGTSPQDMHGPQFHIDEVAGNKTALGHAASFGYIESANVLMEYGADINAGNHTPLYAAAKNGKLNMVNWLIERGANPNQVIQEHRKTPLMIAVQMAERRGNTDIIDVLLQAGADITIEDNGEKTAIRYAVESSGIFNTWGSPQKQKAQKTFAYNIVKQLIRERFKKHRSYPIEVATRDGVVFSGPDLEADAVYTHASGQEGPDFPGFRGAVEARELYTKLHLLYTDDPESDLNRRLSPLDRQEVVEYIGGKSRKKRKRKGRKHKTTKKLVKKYTKKKRKSIKKNRYH